MDIAEHCLDTTYNYSSTRAGQNIRFSYNLWGELTGNVSHEGVDMYNVSNPNCNVYSASAGEIVGPVDAGLGQVRIYEPALNSTVVYLHMRGIPSWISNNSRNVKVSDILGYVSDKGVSGSTHLHIQVQAGRYTADKLPSQSDYALGSIMPYGTASWNI